MAITWKNQVFVNGKWLKVVKPKKGGEKKGDKKGNKDDQGHKSWHETKGDDWACIVCDPWQRDVPDKYKGNYANEDNCRDCGGNKKDHHHMKMIDRAAKIAAGTYKSRDEAKQARMDREAKKSNWSNHWGSKGVWANSWGGAWGTTPDGDNSIGESELAELFLQNQPSAKFAKRNFRTRIQ